MFTVAPKDSTKLATAWEMLFTSVATLMVTGRVAADEEVEKAVSTAGVQFFMNGSGFSLVKRKYSEG